jgi:hypothetical protein
MFKRIFQITSHVDTLTTIPLFPKIQWILSTGALSIQKVARRFLEVNIFAVSSAIGLLGLSLFFVCLKYIYRNVTESDDYSEIRSWISPLWRLDFFRCSLVFLFLASSIFILLICSPTPRPPHTVDHCLALWNAGLTSTHSPSPCSIHLDHYISHVGYTLSSGEYCFLNHTLDF